MILHVHKEGTDNLDLKGLAVLLLGTSSTEAAMIASDIYSIIELEISKRTTAHT